MGKQTRSRAQPQSLGQTIYPQDTGTGDWQETAQMPTFATVYTPDPVWLSLQPRPAELVSFKACLSATGHWATGLRGQHP